MGGISRREAVNAVVTIADIAKANSSVDTVGKSVNGQDCQKVSAHFLGSFFKTMRGRVLAAVERLASDLGPVCGPLANELRGFDSGVSLSCRDMGELLDQAGMSGHFGIVNSLFKAV